MERRILKVDELEPGCELAKAVTKNGDVLFLAGRRLSERDIKSMQRWDVRIVTVKKDSLEGGRITPQETN